MLTGRHTWQIEQAGTHDRSFPTNYVVFPDLLEQAGYWSGYTGKGWGPGNWKVSGRTRNPAGPEFSRRTTSPPFNGIAKNAYDGSLGPMHGAYEDIDGGPTKSSLTRGYEDPALDQFLQLAVAKRPAEELFDDAKDPVCLQNLSAAPSFAKVKNDLLGSSWTI